MPQVRNPATKIDDDTLAILSALEFPDRHQVVIAEQLSRGRYKRVDEILRTLGGAWSRKDRAHVFSGDAREVIDLVITAGRITLDADVGHFPTPDPLARALVAMAGVAGNMRVLEPSAGTGAIVLALQDAGAIVTCVEQSPVRREHLLLRVLKSRDDLADEDDFMTYRSGTKFDRVVMNPPFCRSGLGDHLDHVRRAYGLLKPRGVLVSVMPSSLAFRRDGRHAEMRDWCLARGAITPLPDGSFRTSGTDVRTVAVRIEAPSSRSGRGR